MVFKAVIKGTNTIVAVKRVVQDRKYKVCTDEFLTVNRFFSFTFSPLQNRELQVMKLLNHPNCTTMHTYFYTQDEKTSKTHLNMVLEYIPETVHSICRYFAKQRKTLPMFYAKVSLFR